MHGSQAEGDAQVWIFLNKTADMTDTLYALKWQSLLLDIIRLHYIFTKGKMATFGNGGLRQTRADRILWMNRWMDGQLVMQNTF